MKTLDVVKSVQGLGNGIGDWETKIRIRFYNNEEDKKLNLILFSNAPDNKGTDVMDALEFVATKFVQEDDIDFAKCLYVAEATPKEFKLAIFSLQVTPNKIDPKKIQPNFSRPGFKNLRKEHVESLAQEKV